MKLQGKTSQGASMNANKNRGMTRLVSAIVLVIACGAAIYSAFVYSSNESSKFESVTDREDIIYALLDSQSYPLCVFDSDGKAIFWNDAIELLTGKTLEQINKDGLESIMPPGIDKQEHHMKMLDAFKNPKLHTKELRIHCNVLVADRKSELCTITVSMLHTASGRDFAVTRIQPEARTIRIGNPPTANNENDLQNHRHQTD